MPDMPGKEDKSTTLLYHMTVTCHVLQEILHDCVR